MPVQYRYMVHTEGPALWPDHKPLEEVLDLQATTPITIWEGTYQGNPTPPQGTIFLRSWWINKNRYDPQDTTLRNKAIARWISWDTALKDEEDSAFTACTVGELLPDYRLLIREVWRERIQFPELPAIIEDFAKRYNRDLKLREVLVEDKASGTSAYQSLMKSAGAWLTEKLVAFYPTEDKITRANQAALWCRNDCILLPHPGDSVPWLLDFEDELFDFPGSTYKDQVDSFDQLILWTENLLSTGYHARNATKGNIQ